MDISLNTDGPHSPEYTREVADALAEAVRVLNYSTRSGEAGLESPADGPWERPLDVRHKNFVMAALPEGEQGSWNDGTIPADFSSHKGPTGRYAGQRERVSVVSAAIWSIGGLVRKRSGRDLDYIASMQPGVALAVADWLDDLATELEQVMPGAYTVVNHLPALAVARAYLGSGQ